VRRRLSAATSNPPNAGAVDVILRDGSTLRLRAPASGDADATVELDTDAYAAASPDAEIAVPCSPVRILLLYARENLIVARAS
jgi:hypothetical protein